MIYSDNYPYIIKRLGDLLDNVCFPVLTSGFLFLLTITLFTKIHNILLTLLKSQSDIFPQNRKEKRERKTTYNGLSTELNKGITEIVQKKKKNNVYSGRTQKP